VNLHICKYLNNQKKFLALTAECLSVTTSWLVKLRRQNIGVPFVFQGYLVKVRVTATVETADRDTERKGLKNKSTNCYVCVVYSAEHQCH